MIFLMSAQSRKITTLHPLSNRIICACLSLVLLPCLAVVADAQVGGSLSGTITDASGGVIPGATVSIMNTAIGTELTGVTDTQGHFSFPNVSVGRYDLTVTLEGSSPTNARA
jgi:hypothetical protein